MKLDDFLSINVFDRLNHPDGRTWRVAGGLCTNELPSHSPAVVEDLPGGEFSSEIHLAWNAALERIVDNRDYDTPHPVFNDEEIQIERGTGTPFE